MLAEDDVCDTPSVVAACKSVAFVMSFLCPSLKGAICKYPAGKTLSVTTSARIVGATDQPCRLLQSLKGMETETMCLFYIMSIVQ